MIKVFVSGCYDIIHAGHIQFFKDARALGDNLTVCFASAKVLKLAKKREPSLPDEHKKTILESIKYVDKVVSSSDIHPVFDFVTHLKNEKPDLLVVTNDDRNVDIKEKLCKKLGIKLIVLPKRINITPISTTKIITGIKTDKKIPLRVDFAGGWLDVPKLSINGGFIVNCAISPLVSLKNWPYKLRSGLGGSAGYAILNAKDGVKSELNLGVGWQDPAVINKTGLCIWRSGKKPVLEAQFNPDWLTGKMLIYWTGNNHDTPSNTFNKRDYTKIYRAGWLAKEAVHNSNLDTLANAIKMSYNVQIKEGMEPLPVIKKSLACKYLGGGFGGYALYLFKSKVDRDNALTIKNTKKIEPYIK